MSAHADRGEILRWLRHAAAAPGRLCLVHGEPGRWTRSDACNGAARLGGEDARHMANASTSDRNGWRSLARLRGMMACVLAAFAAACRGERADTRARRAYARKRYAIVDLTESNPTRSGIRVPAGPSRALAGARSLGTSRIRSGLSAARDAVAGDQRRAEPYVDPAHVVLTASTSEAYSWLFKLLCDPGDSVLVPQPSYPLFEHLDARSKGFRRTRTRSTTTAAGRSTSRRWPARPQTTRAVLIVSPNNPTGSLRHARPSSTRCRELCRRRGLGADC